MQSSRLLIAVMLLGLAFPESIRAAEIEAAGRPVPPLSGAYDPKAAREHPFVFTNRTEMLALLQAGTPATKRSLALLEGRVRALLKTPEKYSEVYSGCDIDKYQQSFSYGNDSAVVVSMNLATYAYLASLGKGYGDPQLASAAQAMAKDIMLRWASTGFQENGQFRTDLTEYCSANSSENAKSKELVGLMLGRAMPYWVQAQDMLLAVGAFNAQETSTIDGFIKEYLKTLIKASNYKAGAEVRECDRYNNQTSANLLGMLAIARLYNMGGLVTSIAKGSDATITLPWTAQIQGTIYGNNDKHRSCYDPKTTNPAEYFEIGTVSPGEIVDRFRAKVAQPFGYTLGSLAELSLAAKILESSGFKAFEYQAASGQSLKLALDYYSYYFSHIANGDEQLVPDAVDAYPSYKQYVGKLVSRKGGATLEGKDELLNAFLIGTYAFPSDEHVKGVVTNAKQSGPGTPAFSAVDPLYMQYLPDLEK